MTRHFKLEIELGNSAMKTARQVSMALVQVANKLRALRPLKNAEAKIMDENGNSVGKWEVIESETENKA